MHRLAQLGHDDIGEIGKESVRSLVRAQEEGLDEKRRSRQ